MLNAFLNVANTLRAIDTDADEVTATADAERLANESLRLVERQYQLGAVSYLASLDAQRTYLSTRVALVQARAARFTDTAALFQSLGGGWWNAPDAVASAASASLPRRTLNTTNQRCASRRSASRRHDDIEHEIWSENMTKRMLIMIGAVVLLVVALGFGFFLHIKKLMASAPKPSPQTVTATKVGSTDWQPTLAAVGSVTPVRGVDVTTEIAGLVREIHFKSGQDVKKGDVLVELNADSDKAQLAALEASAPNCRPRRSSATRRSSMRRRSPRRRSTRTPPTSRASARWPRSSRRSSTRRRSARRSPASWASPPSTPAST